ncbi:unnamed protein product [Caenorhabditis bovis]|uniref:Uncharacterized protein n=1 Tax=Caenorhabditis bovis TaxID=2654633 RepID=A0A8S1F261_9PELO|nr:unnamed protein product [Caenorhabditis bovis]
MSSFLIFLLLIFGNTVISVQLLPPNLANVCATRPPNCNLLCPYGYIRDVLQQCLCTCAIDPCQTTLCGPSESCIAIGSNRDECPRLTGGVCALRCEKDADCSGRLICCSNGCGRECVDPISHTFPIKSETAVTAVKSVSALPSSFQRLIHAVTNIASNTLSTPLPPTIRNIASNILMPSLPIRPEIINTAKVGQCPPPTGSLTSCVDMIKCTNDMDCGSVEKCCPNECGTTCMEPLKATGCIHMVLAISKIPDKRLPNEYVPYCEKNGRFSSIQCDLQYCWCVDVHYGSEIIGTRTERGQRTSTMCQNPRLCAQKCHNHCPHGYLMDVFGCPLSSCKCLNICQNVRCEHSWESCQLVEPDCANPPCLPVPRCLLNPCRQGLPTKLSNGITALCSSDKDCIDSRCFKIGYNGLGFCCSGEEPSTRDGRCPSQSADKSKCIMEPSSTCFADAECPEDEKCCFNGCTLSCTQPEGYTMRKMSTNMKTTHHYQPGDVEKYNKGHLSSLVADCADQIPTNGTCSTECHSDSQCPGIKRCCRQGCSTTCMYPVRSTPCFHLALTAELYSLRTAMKCDRAGNFEQYQCDDEGCFCVDIVTGEPLPGSRVLGRKPHCEIRNPCEPLVCKSACPYGFEKAENFCPTCKCRNPCEDIKCPQGSVCVMSSVQCYQQGNCPPQPRCVLDFCPTGGPYVSAVGNIESCSKDEECPSSTHWCHSIGLSSGGICCPSPVRARHVGSCPVVPISLDAKMCRVSCRVDDDCRMHQKCCFDGCGSSCRDITTSLVEFSKEIFEKPGTCITEQRILCNRLEKNTCEYDSDCAGVAKCCDDGCNKSCAYPLQTSKCLVRKTNLQKMGQMDLIKCRPDGSFEQIQCDTEYCWCVDEEGTYIEGTKTGDDQTPNCPPPCPKHDCRPIKCEYGFKKDSNGCPTCNCVDPCENVSCPSDSICVPTSVPCVIKPCPTIPRCIINPCPASETIRNQTSYRVQKCLTDKDCFSPVMTTHCSMLTQDDGFCCTGEKQDVHDGSCPKITEVTAATVEKCVQECRKDSDCSAKSKCCWNGCGLTCVSAITNFVRNEGDSRHFGECLKVAPLGAFCLQRPALEDCKDDSDCPSLLKCCSDGCVRRCTHPHIAPLCVHQRLSALKIAEDDKSSESQELPGQAVFVPDCDTDGEFDEIQSHFGLMWCVNEAGIEVPGTKSVRVPNCDKPRPCLTISCPTHCEHGFKTDNNGCPVCDCISPCEFISCPAGNVCRLVPVQCSSKFCRPVAKCIPNMCSHGEPLGLEHSLLATCTQSMICPTGFYCQNSGFSDISFCCPAPGPPQKSLKCPRIPLMLSSVDGSSCVVGCRQHSDCRNSSCCFNGCGTSCQFETKQIPIKPVKKQLLNNIKIERKASKIENIVESHAISPIIVNSPTILLTTTLPATTVKPKIIKLGTCPKLLINHGCTEQCKEDNDCPGLLKCCQASCGTLCTNPRISTACIHRLLAFELRPEIDGVLPSPTPIRCNPDGSFRKYQCDTSLKQCWCVNVATGNEVPGTRTTALSDEVRIDCSLTRICSIKCESSHCPYGVRLDSNGCPSNGVCECANICDSYQCPSHMECALRRVECTSHPCPDVPACVDVMCAIPQRDIYRNILLCENDGNCAKTSKCIFTKGAEFGVCCHQRPVQNSVVNVIATPIITTTLSNFVEVAPIDTPLEDIATNCTTMRGALESLIRFGATIQGALPICDADGNYSRTQCDPTSCWCADALSGEEIHGTRKMKITKNACKSRSICLSKCARSMCPYGLQLDITGCPKPECICKSACENIECLPGHVCILRKAECNGKWCLPVPTCEKSPCNSGLKPLIESRTRQQYSCTQNTVCPVGYYCTAFDNYMHGVCCPATDSIKSVGIQSGNSCPHGDPFSSLPDGTPHSCTVLTNGCPPTHYCSTIPGKTTGVCCVAKRHACNLKLDVGPCTSKLPRFYYNSITHTCDPFTYGGCAGNLNNFATINDCENYCAGIGLDLSSPYAHATAQMPIESYQIAFTFTGQRIEPKLRQDAERKLINLLVERFSIPRGSIEDVVIRDDNSVKFTIRDVESRVFAREVSEEVSNGKLSIALAGHTLKAEPHTLVAHHIAEESFARNNAKMIFYAILLASAIFVMLAICVFCFSCFCYYRNQPKDRATSSPNTTIRERARNPPHLQRVFSRDDISICSDFHRPATTLETSSNMDRNRRLGQSWFSIG